jgi:hypothetical protein
MAPPEHSGRQSMAESLVTMAFWLHVMVLIQRIFVGLGGTDRFRQISVEV